MIFWLLDIAILRSLQNIEATGESERATNQHFQSMSSSSSSSSKFGNLTNCPFRNLRKFQVFVLRFNCKVNYSPMTNCSPESSEWWRSRSSCVQRVRRNSSAPSTRSFQKAFDRRTTRVEISWYTADNTRPASSRISRWPHCQLLLLLLLQLQSLLRIWRRCWANRLGRRSH